MRKRDSIRLQPSASDWTNSKQVAPEHVSDPVLQKMGKPTKNGTRMTFAPVQSAGEYEAEMQRILEDGKKLGLKFEKKKEEK